MYTYTGIERKVRERKTETYGGTLRKHSKEQRYEERNAHRCVHAARMCSKYTNMYICENGK